MEFSCETSGIRALLAELAERINEALDRWSAPAEAPAELAEAMRYAVLGGGKRLRPALVLLSAGAADGGRPATDPMPAAVAVELVHCYSLVHDDLPAMDDDELRRGRPTVHVKFSEAMGILVGDALLTRAFEILAEHVESPEVTAALIAELARAAGAAGMVGGQAADMALCAVPDGQAGVRHIHMLKTAAMFAGAARMGAACAAAAPDRRDALGAFGADLGLAFQVTDDLLDATAASDVLGKTVGKDAAGGKRTYASLLGVESARLVAADISARALDRLANFGAAAEPLRALAGLLLDRKR